MKLACVLLAQYSKAVAHRLDDAPSSLVPSERAIRARPHALDDANRSLGRQNLEV